MDNGETKIKVLGGSVSVELAPSRKRVYMVCNQTFNGKNEARICLDKDSLLRLKNGLEEALKQFD
jgi:hypothetical protein